MSTRWLLILVLVIIAGGLGVVVYTMPGLEPAGPPQSITALNPDNISEVVIKDQALEPVVLIKQFGSWYLAGDPELPADGDRVRTLLRLAQAESVHRYELNTLNPEALGLNPPRAALTMNHLPIYIGSTDALDNRRYVQVDDKVHLIEDTFQQLITGERTAFVSRQPLSGRGTITRLELPGLTLASVEGQWLLEPDDSQASADTIQQLVDLWQHAAALYVRQYTGSGSGETVTLYTSGSEAPLVFELLSRSPDLTLARPEWGIEYHFNGNMEQHLFALPIPEPQPDPEPEQRGDEDTGEESDPVLE